ncbi:MAG: putative zinc-binding metallopeptidase [Planctomycetota bacterium]
MRLCDLDVQIEGTVIERRVERLYAQLERRDLRLRPHVWLSSEWFSPDGIPGIAIPFYLAHPRLMRLEKKMMLEVEGGAEEDCLRLLRHEAGHVISTAFRLHRRKPWREVFGPVGKKYPTYYHPQPFSREYVLHLPWWYAQAHPAEDFAETFAVWLQPRARWRQWYADWPALKKLEFVDELMSDIAGERAPVRSRKQVEPLRHLRSTLRQHYARKQRRYAEDSPDFYDRDLKRIFPTEPERNGSETAAAFLRRQKLQIRQAVAAWTDENHYMIDQVLRDMMRRSRDLKLRRTRDESETRTDVMLMVTVQTMNYLHGGRHRIAL